MVLHAFFECAGKVVGWCVQIEYEIVAVLCACIECEMMMMPVVVVEELGACIGSAMMMMVLAVVVVELGPHVECATMMASYAHVEYFQEMVLEFLKMKYLKMGLIHMKLDVPCPHQCQVCLHDWLQVHCA